VIARAIGDLLPSALAVALSPIPIVAVVLVLGTPKSRANGIAFAIGWVVGLTSVGLLVLGLTSATDRSGTTSVVVDVAKLAVGGLFLVMAVRKWRGRPRGDDEPSLPAWMASLGDVEPRRALGLGLLLAGANPKNLALTATAAGTVAQIGLEGWSRVAVALVYVTLGSATVLAAVIAHLVDAARAAPPLDALRRTMTAHGTVIMVVVLAILGASLLGDAIAGLFG
jgi:threonine/homoserine/homoserine lactone efflux protein